MHPLSIITFLILLASAIFAGIAGREKGHNLGLILFSLGGLLPLLSRISNDARLPVPHNLELIGFFSAIPLFFIGLAVSKRKENPRFLVVAAIPIIVAFVINVMILGLLNMQT
jgi:hypothetical protein